MEKVIHNKPIIIIGNGGHSKVLQEVILLNNLSSKNPSNILTIIL